MSADSFHHQIEKGMRAAKNVYDGGDFSAIVNTSGLAVAMSYEDFVQYENGVSQGAYTNKPLLADVHEVRFVRGSTKMQWKESMEDADYKEGDFLKKKVAAKILKEGETFPAKDGPRGLEEKKKDAIITNLCRFMPLNHHHFWKNLATSQMSTDLLDSD